MMTRVVGRRVAIGASIAMVLACGGFAADVSGTSLTIDGAAWKVVGCESGQALGFPGLELTGEDGRRLRLGFRADGALDVLLWPVGATSAEDLGACATGAFPGTGLEVNNITALAGKATLDCPTVKGEVVVARCATPLLRSSE